MPINPNILLQGGGVPNVGGAFQSGVQTGGMLQQLQQQRALAPLQKQMLEQQVQTQANAMADAEEKRQLISGHGAWNQANDIMAGGDIGGAIESLITRRAQLKAAGKTDTSHTNGALQLLGAMEQGGEIGEQAKLRWNALGETLQGQMQLSGLDVGGVAAKGRFGKAIQGVDDKGNTVFFQPNLEGGSPRVLEGITPTKPKALPGSFVKGLPPESQQAVSDAYQSAGGGKEGLAVANQQVKKELEKVKLENIPSLLSDRFPKASEDEQRQLSAAIVGAKDVASGLKEAGKIREKQIQVKKGRVFKERALTLVDNILSSDELNDVLGSIEGGNWIPRGDNETDLISDIEEVQNIMTSTSLDIMSGVLSETDIKIIADLAGGAFNRKRSEKRFRNDVSKIRDALRRELNPQQGDQKSRLDFLRQKAGL